MTVAPVHPPVVRAASRALGPLGASIKIGENEMLEDIVDVELVIEEADENTPANLGLMPREVYGAIFYATLESDVLPAFERAGVDGFGAGDGAGRARLRSVRVPAG